MATGWNYTYGESWEDYIQRRTITNDLTSAMRDSSHQMVGAISEQTTSILSGFSSMEGGMHTLSDQMGSGMRELGGDINRGFGILYGQMDQIAGKISDLNVSFQWGFGQMIAQIGGMGDSLKALIQIAKTPAQTAAYEQFEIARDAFRQGLYVECLEALNKAIGGDHTSPGYKLEWRFHQMQGVVRLGFFDCDLEQVDPAQAEQSFLMAARYARADAPHEAARAFLSAGWSAYVQGKLPDALKHTELAISLDAKLTEAFFQAAKISMAAGKPGEALPVLRKAIDQSPGYILKAAADGDFKHHEGDLNGFFEAMRQESHNKLAPEVQTALSEAEEWAKDVREVAHCTEILDRWRNLLKGDWGLLDLLIFRHETFAHDRQQLRSAHSRGRERIQKERERIQKEHERQKNTWRIETKTIKLEREIEEPYQVEEPYQEEVVIKPARWFSKAVTERVTKTRIVTKTRFVRRQVEEKHHLLVNGLGEIHEHFRFVRIPAGKFLMGSPASEIGRGDDETQHEVTISKPFDLGIYPVTQSLWQAVMRNNRSRFKGPDLPVENVSWNDAQEFIKELNRMAGENAYRLPTEAEWEYACRAGTTTPFWTGENITTDQANFNGEGLANGVDRHKTTPVAMFKPNPWGLYDMHGNVLEWVQDRYGDYPAGSVTDPLSGGGSYRVCRGGSWLYEPGSVRAAYRDRGSPGDGGSYLGFRLLRTP